MTDTGPRGALPAAEVWREMRLHMEWCEALSLVFLFADGPAALAPIKQWADDAWQFRSAPIQVIELPHAAGAVTDLFEALEAHPTASALARAPAWVSLLASGSADDDWDRARRECLARLNEAREWLSRGFARPLVICLPTAWLRQVGALAPDLWHVRSYVATLLPPASPVAVTRGALEDLDPGAVPHAELLARIERERSEWQALQAVAHVDPSPAKRRLACGHAIELVSLLLAARQVDDARSVALAALEAMRGLRTALGDSPQVLRDLSVSLDRVGDAESQAGHGEAALAAYRESLALSRQLRVALGDSPQVLRDLSVSLDRVGDAESQAGRGEAALAAYRESLDLSRQLRVALGDSPQVLRDLSVSLDRVGDAESQAGRGEAALAAYRESLGLRRQLRVTLGDSPQVLRDLSVSLNKVGDAESQAGRGEAALAAYRESLGLRRQLRVTLGDSPQVLDDLAASLARVAGIALSPPADRRAALDEAIAIWQRLAAAHPSTPRWAQRLNAAQHLAAALPDNTGAPSAT